MTAPAPSRLPTASISEPAREKLAAFHPDVVREVVAALESNDVVVIGMAQNPHVKRARKALTEANIGFHYLEYGSYLSDWQKRLAIKLWSGWPTFPQIFVHGVLVGGADQTQAAIADGSFAARVAAGRPAARS
jgi:glutaredoxin-related protein